MRTPVLMSDGTYQPIAVIEMGIGDGISEGNRGLNFDPLLARKIDENGDP